MSYIREYIHFLINDNISSITEIYASDIDLLDCDFDWECIRNESSKLAIKNGLDASEYKLGYFSRKDGIVNGAAYTRIEEGQIFEFHVVLSEDDWSLFREMSKNCLNEYEYRKISDVNLKIETFVFKEELNLMKELGFKILKECSDGFIVGNDV